MADQTCIKYTISYNTVDGLTGFFYDKFLLSRALKKIARRNLDQLASQLAMDSTDMAA